MCTKESALEVKGGRRSEGPRQHPTCPSLPFLGAPRPRPFLDLRLFFHFLTECTTPPGPAVTSLGSERTFRLPFILIRSAEAAPMASVPLCAGLAFLPGLAAASPFWSTSSAATSPSLPFRTSSSIILLASRLWLPRAGTLDSKPLGWASTKPKFACQLEPKPFNSTHSHPALDSTSHFYFASLSHSTVPCRAELRSWLRVVFVLPRCLVAWWGASLVRDTIFLRQGALLSSLPPSLQRERRLGARVGRF